MRTRQVLLIAVVAMVAVAMFAGAATLTVTEEGEDDEEYEYEDLTVSPIQYENMPESARISGEKLFRGVHWPSDAIGASVGARDDGLQENLSHGEGVDRNTV